MKLSIITINLNNKEGLRKTIESVVNQTFTDYEYIVIDGASTDGSVDIIKEYSDRITYWISEPDKGIYNAMNKGILQAKGEYCLFLNSGDWLVDEMILYKISGKLSNADIIYGNLIKVGANGKNRYSIPPIPENITFFTFFTRTLPHPASFIKRELFNDNLYSEDFRIVSDWKFFIEQIVFKKKMLKKLDMYISFMEGGGISCSPHEEERRRVLSKYIPDEIRAELDILARVGSSPLFESLLFLRKTTRFEKYMAKMLKHAIVIYRFFCEKNK